MLYQVLTIYLFIVQISWNNDISKSSRIIVQILFTSLANCLMISISKMIQKHRGNISKNQSKRFQKY